MAGKLQGRIYIIWQRWRVPACRTLLIVCGFLWSSLIVSLTVNLFSSWLFLPRATDLHATNIEPFLDWIQQHEPLLLALLVGISLLLILLWRGSRLSQKPSVSPIMALTAEQCARVRIQLLQGFLREYQQRKTDSLQGRTAIVLGLHERSDLVRASSQLVFQRLETPEEHALPAGTSIIQAYDQAQRGLLILGAPGAGKSTLLLDLASELLSRAQNEDTHPIPVILNLSSWGQQRVPMDRWLVEQLHLAYAISPRVSRALLEQQQWLLLLDGLDEVAGEARAACIKAINMYYVLFLMPLVVCSRQHEYVEQEAKLALPMAVIVQPLEFVYILDYLKRESKAVSAARTVLQSNAELRNLVKTPLMLNVVILAYHGRMVKDLPQMGSGQEQQRQIFACYVERMLGRPLARSRYASQQAQDALIYLAQQMSHLQQTEWYVEQLDSLWLPTKQWQIGYRWLYGLLCGLFFVLLSGPYGLGSGLLSKLFLGLFFGLLGGLLGGCYTVLDKRNLQPVEVFARPWKVLWILFLGLAIGLFLGLAIGLFLGLAIGLFLGLAIGLFFGLLSGLLFFALSGNPLAPTVRRAPNQGIMSSFWNALRFGPLSGLVVGLFFGLAGGLFFGLAGGLFFGLAGGLFFGLLFWLCFGGQVCVCHYILRFLLWRSNAMPYHLVQFFEEACERILLLRVGGGYRFIHPLFQNYFASLTRSVSSQQTSSHTGSTP